VKRLVVGTIEALASISTTALVLAGLVVGHVAGGMVGALLGGAAAFLAVVIVFGALFILLEMNERPDAIRVALERSDR
jgi:heme/copper-type cytochrome/quinol oxidase subunit 3